MTGCEIAKRRGLRLLVGIGLPTLILLLSLPFARSAAAEEATEKASEEAPAQAAPAPAPQPGQDKAQPPTAKQPAQENAAAPEAKDEAEQPAKPRPEAAEAPQRTAPPAPKTGVPPRQNPRGREPMPRPREAKPPTREVNQPRVPAPNPAGRRNPAPAAEPEDELRGVQVERSGAGQKISPRRPAEPPEPSPRMERTHRDDMRFTLDFNNVEFIDLIKTIVELTGKTFYIDDQVTRQAKPVTILGKQRVTREEAYKVFESILDVQNFTPVETATGIIKIVPSREARSSNIQTFVAENARVPYSDVIVTRLVQCHYVNAKTISALLDKMKSKNGDVQPYEPTNTLIITDTAVNIERMLKILRELDVKEHDVAFRVIPVLYYDAEELASLVQEIMGQDENQPNTTRTRRSSRRRGNEPQGDEESEFIPSSMKIIPDPRTNALIVVGTQTAIDKLLEIIEQLDTPAGGPEEKIRVYYLEYADAETLAGTLNSVVSGIAQPPESGNAPGSAENRGNVPSVVRRAQARRAAQPGGDEEGEGSKFEGEVQITADPDTNSLVISASRNDFELLKKVIEKLDIRRRQVFVEGLILEMGVKKNVDYGFEFRALDEGILEDGTSFFGGTNLAGGSGINTASGADITSGASALSIPGVIVGAADGTIQFGGREFLNIGAFFRAIKTDSEVNVISRPHLLTTDNEEAEIVVANNLPFRTGSSQTTVSTLSTIERRDVGLTLRITPQVNESDHVKLEIFQEVSQIIDSPQGLDVNDVGPSTSKRTASSVVIVKDRQTAIIGGLMSEDSNRTESKVPLLGDIPVIGWLFRSTTNRNDKTNLLIFLTPHIVKDDLDQTNIGLWKMQDRNTFRRYHFGEFDEGDRFYEDMLQQREGILRRYEPQRGGEGANP